MANPDWQQTYTGGIFETFNPDPQKLKIKDIAHALSNQCRFAGHCREFYSVAQHSVLVARLCSPSTRLEGLLHDAAEAFVVDLPTPVKRQLPKYMEAEDRVAKAIAERFDLVYPWPAVVKDADAIMLATEAESLMVWPPPRDWHLAGSYDSDMAVSLEIPWSSYEAEQRFLEAYNLLRRS